MIGDRTVDDPATDSGTVTGRLSALMDGIAATARGARASIKTLAQSIFSPGSVTDVMLGDRTVSNPATDSGIVTGQLTEQLNNMAAAIRTLRPGAGQSPDLHAVGSVVLFFFRSRIPFIGETVTLQRGATGVATLGFDLPTARPVPGAWRVESTYFQRGVTADGSLDLCACHPGFFVSFRHGLARRIA